jgi:hypothetical protein
MLSSAVDCALDFSVHALEAVFSKWLIACELWSPVQIHIIIICWDTDCEQYTFFGRIERRWLNNWYSFETGAVGVVCVFHSFLTCTKLTDGCNLSFYNNNNNNTVILRILNVL